MSGRKPTPIPTTRYVHRLHANSGNDTVLLRGGGTPLHAPPPTRFGATLQAKPEPSPTSPRHMPPPTRFSVNSAATIQRMKDADDDPEPWKKFQKAAEQKKKDEKQKKWKEEEDEKRVKEKLAETKDLSFKEINKHEICAIVALSYMSGEGYEGSLKKLNDSSRRLSKTKILEYCDDAVINDVYPTHGKCTSLAVPGKTTLEKFMSDKAAGTYAISIVMTEEISHIFVIKKEKSNIEVVADSEKKEFSSYRKDIVHAAFKKK